MKIFLKIISLIFLFFTFGCDVFELPEYQEYKNHQLLTYDLNEQLEVRLNIDYCQSVVKIDVHNERTMMIEMAFNDHTNEKITFEYEEGQLLIQSINRGITLCNKSKDISSYILITIPNHLLFLDIQSNAYSTTMMSEDVSVTHLNFKCRDGTFIFLSASIKHLNLELLKGKILLEHAIGTITDIYMTSGRVEINDVELSEMTININKGDLELNRVKTNSLNSNISLGNTRMDQVEVKDELTIINDFGQVDLKNVYVNQVNLLIKEGELIYNNDDATFFIHSLRYSLQNGEASFNIRGNIIKQ